MESLVAPWMAQCLQQGVLLPNARFPNPWRRQECWPDVQKCTSFETNYLDSLCPFLAIVIPVAWNCYFESWGTSLSRKWRMFDDQMACIKAWCSRQHLSASTTSIVDKETWNNPSLTDHLKCASQANHWRRMTYHEAAVLIDSLEWTCPRLPRAMLATGVAKFTVRTVVEVLARASTIEVGYGGTVWIQQSTFNNQVQYEWIHNTFCQHWCRYFWVRWRLSMTTRGLTGLRNW